MEKNRVFGGKCYESLASWHPKSSSWKMSQLSLFEEDVKLLDRLPKSGIAQNGRLYPLETLELGICGKDGLQSPILPTPAAHEARLGYQRRIKGKKGTQKSLTTVVIDQMGGRDKVIGQLNPEFVEWLMGFQIGHTDLGR